jgi:hypothetical protein
MVIFKTMHANKVYQLYELTCCAVVFNPNPQTDATR